MKSKSSTFTKGFLTRARLTDELSIPASLSLCLSFLGKKNKHQPRRSCSCCCCVCAQTDVCWRCGMGESSSRLVGEGAVLSFHVVLGGSDSVILPELHTSSHLRKLSRTGTGRVKAPPQRLLFPLGCLLLYDSSQLPKPNARFSRCAHRTHNPGARARSRFNHRLPVPGITSKLVPPLPNEMADRTPWW